MFLYSVGFLYPSMVMQYSEFKFVSNENGFLSPMEPDTGVFSDTDQLSNISHASLMGLNIKKHHHGQPHFTTRFGVFCRILEWRFWKAHLLK